MGDRHEATQGEERSGVRQGTSDAQPGDVSQSAGSLRQRIAAMGRHARTAAARLATLSTERKNAGLLAMADSLEAGAERIVEANARDLGAGVRAGLDDAMLDRLRLDAGRIVAIAADVRRIAELPDPVGEVLRDWQRPNGLRLEKVRVPIGVIGIIYESRPNVTVDAATLCLKAGNATILRGGSEAIHSNLALAAALQRGAARAELPEHAIQLIDEVDRTGVRHLAEQEGSLDLIIPRGGRGLIEAVTAAARMPVLKHYDGVCHVYVDRAAELEMAAAISHNAKVQRPGVCNAMETLLVHREVAAHFLPRHGRELLDAGVTLHGDPATCELVPEAVPATEDDWGREYLSLDLAVRVVDSLDEALRHIARHGSRHTDAIVTEDEAAAARFLAEVDSATVLHNASTRFADGGEFGFGAEIGISTDKLHARGPMGLEELTIYKYVVRGSGQVR
ncbi:MAG: glutamate-5-semialdehyde dehydrogenase [Acidobacteria bacterium]|nr:MAG: glutamate-5-semialdehyde dehydrogenase [Acidobacteriota bacterium]REK11059.1 MAG: glutamate-5-semialdehyde dehydrogenase [Acidobacteriota bacterium]